MQQPDDLQPTRETIKILWRHARNYPGYLAGIGVVLPITILMHQFLPPLVVAAILTRLSHGDFTPGDLWGSFGPLLLLFALLRISSATIVWRIVLIFLGKLEANVLRDAASRVFKHLLAQSPGFHNDRFSGTLVSQTSKYLSAFVRLLEAAVIQALPLIISVAIVVIILLPKAPVFVAALLAFSALYMMITIFGTRKIREKSGEEAEAQSLQTGQLADALANIMAVKSFATTDFEAHRFSKATEETRQKTLDYHSVNNARELSFSILTSGMTALSIVLAAASVVVFDAQLATAYLVIDYSATIIGRLWQFSSVTLRDVNRAFGEAMDMIKVLHTEPAVKDPDKPEPVRISRGQIQFDRVTFTHADAGDVLFENFSLRLEPGEKIGLVGRSGAGKTTFTKLLMRFSDIDGGRITIDGQDISRIAQDDLRRHIAYVPQEPLLFHRTIRENIAYGRPGASEAEIRLAAEQTFADEFIEKLPKGYDTLVGERGVKLSGGQRQRIAIARALLKDAPILVLDEATSALDSESEKHIQDALLTLMKNRAAIVIAHRLSTIQKMDRIVVMEQGAIIEQGTHQQLLEKKGLYATLWQHQSGGFLEE